MESSTDVVMGGTDETKTIDEKLYSRQLYVLGHEAMARMRNATVLIIGVRGLGMEIAKNVILAGVKAVGLADNNPVALGDLSSAFYFTEEDIGKSRAGTAAPQLAELNRYVNVEVVEEPITETVLKRFGVVVVTGETVQRQVEMNKICRAYGIQFIATDVFGVVCSLFVDFGESWTANDPDGEQPLRGVITSISQDSQGLVTVPDDARHGLSSGAFVTFEAIEGMTELNNCHPREIKFKGPYSFEIGDTSSYRKYENGGFFQEVKLPRKLSFKTLEASLSDPAIVPFDFSKIDNGLQVHALVLGLSDFRLKHGRMPTPDSADDVVELLNLVKLASSIKMSSDLIVNDTFISAVGRCVAGELSPMVSFMGGVAAQEVLKSCTGKFSPLQQFLYFDAVEVLPEGLSIKEFSPRGSRYDSQIAVIGVSVQEKINRLRTFLIGSGAIGCEMLKIWALMGLATSDPGHVLVTDMDKIETSNLNRQFLFRPPDVGKLKSATAAASACRMNPKFRITAHENRVSPDTEDVYNDDFWESVDFVCTALDNVEARLYVDSRCVYYKKPLLESGTLGTKGNTQVVVPGLTESYGSTRDPAEEGIPVCTLKNFPNKIEHTIQWARDAFEGIFTQGPEEVNSYVQNPAYLKELEKQTSSQIEILRKLKQFLVVERPLTFEDCIRWARKYFEKEFNHNIHQLLFNFPVDSVTSTGAKFWSGPKRAPSPLEFDVNDPVHLTFVISAANLLAHVYGLQGRRDPEYFMTFLPSVTVPPLEIKTNMKIAASDEELKAEQKKAAEAPIEDYRTLARDLIGSLPTPASLAGFCLFPLEFEKDDDTNFHMDFIASTANLRARNYRIKEESKHEVKRIAGKIIPAIATSTALVSGLICLELYKLLRTPSVPIESYKCAFVNLALPFFSLAEPRPPDFKKALVAGKEWSWSLWDRIDVDIGDVTLASFLEYFQETLQLDVEMISYGTAMLYSFFGNKKKTSERMKLPMTKLIEDVTKQELKRHSRYILLEVCANNPDGESVEIPYVRLRYR